MRLRRPLVVRQVDIAGRVAQRLLRPPVLAPELEDGASTLEVERGGALEPARGREQDVVRLARELRPAAAT